MKNKGHRVNKRRASPIGRGDDWMDSNEQEMEKTGYFNDPPASERPRRERSRRSLPVPAEEELPVAPGEPLLPTSSGEEKASTEGPRSSGRESPAKKQTGWGWCAVFLSVALLGALWIMGSAMAWTSREVGEGSTHEETDASNLREEPEQGDKVIFVKPYGDADGLLTVPELYDRCADSVVSILGSKEWTSGVGSGFFVSGDGYIATAAHVVEGMDRLKVVTAEGEEHEARLVASDLLTDLALLKIEGQGFPDVSFGASGELLTGERVVAIGTPASLDYAGSVSSGEISYLGRTVKIYDTSGRILQKKMKLIQTNAPVNPGNSGCPLFDEYGRVIGIVTMKLGSNYAGIGFAIPSDGALPILQAMKEGRSVHNELRSPISVTAPRLGIVGEEAVVEGIRGVMVRGFDPEASGASRVLKEGDLIIGIDQATIGAVEDVTATIWNKEPGDLVRVTVVRWGQHLTFEVTLEKT